MDLCHYKDLTKLIYYDVTAIGLMLCLAVTIFEFDLCLYISFKYKNGNAIIFISLRGYCQPEGQAKAKARPNKFVCRLFKASLDRR